MFIDWALKLPALNIIGYLLAFFAAFLEALPGIGLFIPGQTLVAVTGFLAHQGIIHVAPIIFLAILGAIAGDLAGYWIGREYGRDVVNKQNILKEVNTVLKKHPIKTLIFGRFNSITRAFAPFVAGANKIPFGRFMIANVTGGVLWGVCWVGVGYFFGASFKLASQRFEWGALAFAALIIIGFVIYRIKRKRAPRLRSAREEALRTLRREKKTKK